MTYKMAFDGNDYSFQFSGKDDIQTLFDSIETYVEVYLSSVSATLTAVLYKLSRVLENRYSITLTELSEIFHLLVLDISKKRKQQKVVDVDVEIVYLGKVLGSLQSLKANGTKSG